MLRHGPCPRPDNPRSYPARLTFAGSHRLPIHPLDFLAPGTPLPEGFGGTAAPDHTPDGLYSFGPKPARAPLARLIQSSEAETGQLPPALANLALTREAVIKRRLRSMLIRARILPAEAAKPAEAIATRKRLRPLILGHSRAK